MDCSWKGQLANGTTRADRIAGEEIFYERPPRRPATRNQAVTSDQQRHLRGPSCVYGLLDTSINTSNIPVDKTLSRYE